MLVNTQTMERHNKSTIDRLAPSQTDISVIIPAMNEAKRLPVFLNVLLEYCERSKKNYEVLIVDDGSTDNTVDIVLEYQTKYDALQLIKLSRNQGKGQAVKQGLFRACGDIVLFLDADGSTPSKEIEDNLHFFDQGYDIVIGSRVLRDESHQVDAKWYRRIIGQTFNALVQSILFKEIKDTQCGFKMFRREVIRPIFSRMSINRYGFDIEILYIAHKMGYKIKETPVNWTNVDESKVNLITDSIRMFINILQVRNWHFTPINMCDTSMSVQEITYMYKLEKIHWWFQSKNELIKSLVRRMNRPFPMILDAGCGTGLNLSFLKDFGKCFGSDFVNQALLFCKKNNLKRLCQCNLEETSFKDKQFDLITSLDVIEHIEDYEKVLVEFRRILKDDGKVIITVPAFKFLWSQHDEALSHLRRFHRKELRHALEDAGFKVERIGYFFFISFLIVTPIRLIRKLFVKDKEAVSDTTTLPPKPLNALLKLFFKWEAQLIPYIRFPFGTTLYAVASKNHESQ